VVLHRAFLFRNLNIYREALPTVWSYSSYNLCTSQIIHVTYTDAAWFLSRRVTSTVHVTSLDRYAALYLKARR
jgi:hypothetical protein